MGHFLVTGAAGFIAAQVIQLLLEADHTVVGLDNFEPTYDPRLKHWRLQQLTAQPGFRFHPTDIRDRLALEAVWRSTGPFEAVINLAARAGVRASVEAPVPYYETNVLGTLNLLELCRRTGVRKCVMASSSSLYGNSSLLPYQETAETSLPLSPYAASKKAMEELCYAYHYLHQLDISVLRYFSVYGPAGRPDMSPFRFVQWVCEGRPVNVFGDGRQQRDFTFIADIARGTVAALRPLGFAIINLGSDRPVCLLEMIRLIEQLAGRTARLNFLPAHPADVPATWADISRAANLLSWRPMVSVEAGLEQLVSWYLAERHWAQSIQT